MGRVARFVVAFAGLHAWWVFLANGLLYVWFGWTDLDGAVHATAQVAAMSLLVIGVLTTAISVTALRRGERWAWVAMLIWPVFNTSLIAFGNGWPGTEAMVIAAWLVILALPVIALALSAPAYLRAAPPRR